MLKRGSACDAEAVPVMININNMKDRIAKVLLDLISLYCTNVPAAPPNFAANYILQAFGLLSSAGANTGCEPPAI